MDTQITLALSTLPMYKWHSYSPYLQGFDKIELEKISKEFSHQGVKTCIFNIPEILTKSSNIFPGLEIPLYTLLGALKKESAQKVLERLSGITEKNIQEVMDITQKYFETDAIKKQSVFEKWPQHNSPEYISLMLSTAKQLSQFIPFSLNLLLSEVVQNSCGRLILQELTEFKRSVVWIGHDIIAKESSNFH